jgi:hypothetical protein
MEISGTGNAETPISKSVLLSNIANHLAELDDILLSTQGTNLAADLEKLAETLRLMFALLSDMPGAFDDACPWWKAWQRVPSEDNNARGIPPTFEGPTLLT